LKLADDLFRGIEIFRTAEEMKDYFKIKKIIINSDKEYKEMARLRKGMFKKFLEEFYPLYCFSCSRFCNTDSKMKIVVGNQRYEAIVLNDGKEEKFEFTS
jgi:hypothetical protein